MRLTVKRTVLCFKFAVRLFQLPIPHPKLPMLPFERAIPPSQLFQRDFKLPERPLQRAMSLFQRAMPLSQRRVPLLKISERAITQLQPPMPFLQLSMPPSQRLVLLFQLRVAHPKRTVLSLELAVLTCV